MASVARQATGTALADTGAKGPEVGNGADPAAIVGDLGALATLIVASSPARPAERVVIHDGERPADFQRGDVVLGIGVRSQTTALVDLIRSAGESHAAALVLKADVKTLDNWVIMACRDNELALIGVDPHVPWGRLYLFIQASIGSRAFEFDDGAQADIALGDMSALAGALSQLVGGPAILEDAYFRVVGYSAYAGESDRGREAAILSRHIPPEWMAYLRGGGILEKLRNSDDVMYLDQGPDGARPRLLTSVKADGELVGIIWISEGDSPLDSGAADRLRQARSIAAPHFQRYLTTDRLGSFRRSESLRRILEGTGSARELGLDVRCQYCLVAIRKEGLSESEWLTPRTREWLSAHIESYDRTTVMVVVDGTLYALARLIGPADPDRLRATLERLSSDGPFRDAPILIAISSPHSIDNLASDAIDEVRALCALPSSPSFGRDRRLIVGWEAEAAVLAKRVENTLRREGIASFSRVVTLQEHDKRHGTTLVETLATYLMASCSVSRASAVLGIHQTTLRYRLDRILSVSGLDLADHLDCLAAQLHLLAAGRLISPRLLASQPAQVSDAPVKRTN